MDGGDVEKVQYVQYNTDIVYYLFRYVMFIVNVFKSFSRVLLELTCRNTKRSMR